MISLLTEPAWSWHIYCSQFIGKPKSGLIWLSKKLFHKFLNQYGGPTAVTRSLIDGLNLLGNSYNYNPSSKHIQADCVVLSNIDALSNAISLKRSGKIKRLLAGPNIVTLPSEAGRLIAEQEVDVCLVPSKWVKDLYLKD